MSTTAAAGTEEDTYIDYDTFLSPTFSPYAFANTLIRSTNDPSDSSLDLSTPLSRVLFDLQEIDSHLHGLTTTSALPLLSSVSTTHTASDLVLSAVTTQLEALNTTYAHLRRDIAARSSAASQILTAVERLHSVTSQLREISRALVLARQIELQLSDLLPAAADHHHHHHYKALVRLAQSILELRRGNVLVSVDPDVEIAVVLRNQVFRPAETAVLQRAREGITEYHPIPLAGGGDKLAAATEGMRGKAAAGATALFLLSSPKENELLTSAVQGYINAAVNGSLSALTRSLTALSTLDRSCAEVATRCQNLVSLGGLLHGIPRPGSEGKKGETLLDSVLDALDTPNLQSRFFRSLATGLEPRVREVVNRGGANARILKGAKERLRNALKGTVERGLVGLEGEKQMGGLELAVAVMLGAVGSLGR
jgi:hypothetical protein